MFVLMWVVFVAAQSLNKDVNILVARQIYFCKWPSEELLHNKDVWICWPTSLYSQTFHCLELLDVVFFFRCLRFVALICSSRLVSFIFDEVTMIGVFVCSIDDKSDGIV